MKISLIIPTLNEEKNISTVLKEIPKSISEIIIVDGHSKDNTVKIAKKYKAKILYDNHGKGSALIKGLKAAKHSIVITMDADCSHRVEEIKLLNAGIEAGYDVVVGSRFLQGGGTEDMPWYRKFGNKFFVFLVNLLWNTKYSDLAYGYRAFRKSIVHKLKLESTGFGIETEMSIRAAKLKLKILEIPSFEKARLYGSGKLRTFRDGFNILNRILKELLIRK